MSHWTIIIGMGVITVLIRLSFIVLGDRFAPGDKMRRGLRYVPAAVLATFIFTDMFQQGGKQLQLSLDNHWLLAGAAAIIIAWLSKSTFLTIAAGLLILALLSTIFPV